MSGVSVPLRGLEVFGQNAQEVCHETLVRGFRPLAGIRGLRTPTRGGSRRRKEKVSVPLRGLEVFGPSMAFLVMDSAGLVSVPLRGLEVFGLCQSACERRARAKVSVPLRGLEVFGPQGGKKWLRIYSSFRPLAGIRGLRTPVTTCPANASPEFPSPCGD